MLLLRFRGSSLGIPPCYVLHGRDKAILCIGMSRPPPYPQDSLDHPCMAWSSSWHPDRIPNISVDRPHKQGRSQEAWGAPGPLLAPTPGSPLAVPLVFFVHRCDGKKSLSYIPKVEEGDFVILSCIGHWAHVNCTGPSYYVYIVQTLLNFMLDMSLPIGASHRCCHVRQAPLGLIANSLRWWLSCGPTKHSC
jgi:hypothetical protein